MIQAADTYDVAIAGAGPAGTSAAIHLALQGARVLLCEQKRFPRAKLCGEFISPECLPHFERLGVAEQMLSAGGARLNKTVFYSRAGHNVTVPSHWFNNNSEALGLSRAEMDHKLIERAKSVGVSVLEDAHVSDLILEGERVRGIRIKTVSQTSARHAEIIIDATGRAHALVRRLKVQSRAPHAAQRSRFIAFKAHLENAQVADGVCEIYFYPGGYGGLSTVEDGLSNLCFIAAAKEVRRLGSDPETVIREMVMKNARAAHTLDRAIARTEWLSVSLEKYGRRSLVPAEGLLTIGDAAAFIDPFTGSGMLMALESGEVAAQTIIGQMDKLGQPDSFAELAREYRSQYSKLFDSRLRVSGFLRRAAFVPRLAEAAILCFGASDKLRRKVARATRPAPDHETGVQRY
ncbi:MAG: NAD(P)/FAD-dependent oxidoreductase [Acidobacteriota bacterium]